MNGPIQLIMSGAVVSQELAAEFGPLPPAFLPVGAQPLYALQVEALPRGRSIHLVLPESFDLCASDVSRLNMLGVERVLIPEGLSLGEAVMYALNDIGHLDHPVQILHGDTLIQDVDWTVFDAVVVGLEGDEYAWAEVDANGDRLRRLRTVPTGAAAGAAQLVASGYFAFQSSLDLVRAITRARGDFIEAVNRYAERRPMRILSAGLWLDFGHLQTFFQARLVQSTARAFNTVRIDGQTARKSSEHSAKIVAEAEWLRKVPPDVQIFTARLMDSGEDAGRAYYTTAYEYLPSLAELFVFGAIGRPAWMRILKSCADFLRACSNHRGPGQADVAMRALCREKTLGRLEQFAASATIPIDRELRLAGRKTPSLVGIAEQLDELIDYETLRPESVMHGDFCFSNILYDSRTRRIRVIDPRGSITIGGSIFGDARYDLAKLSHSVVGRYDQIIAGRCRVTRDSRLDFAIDFDGAPHHAWLETAFENLEVDGIGAKRSDVHAAMICLFLSMLPLHGDRPDRQTAFIANVLRLFTDLEDAAG